MTLSELLEHNGAVGLTDADLATLADWAGHQKYRSMNPAWKKPYALLREGADVLLRRRAGDKQTPQIEKENKLG